MNLLTRLVHRFRQRNDHKLNIKAHRQAIDTMAIFRRNLKAQGYTPLEIQAAMIEEGMIPDVRVATLKAKKDAAERAA